MVHGAKILFTSGENTFRLEKTNMQRTYKSQGKTHAFFKRYIFFHVFTSENMGDTSALVYGETPIKP